MSLSYGTPERDDDDERDDSQLVLDAIAGKRPNSKDVVRANCPFCELVVHKVDRKQCLSVNIRNGYWKCYRCEAHGRLHSSEIPFDVSTLQAKPREREEKPAVNLPEGFVHLWRPEGQSMACAQARKYLSKHRVGVTPEVIEAAKIGAVIRGRYAGRVCVPIYKAGKMVGFMTRSWKKKPPPSVRTYLYSDDFDRATTIYNEEALYVTTEYPCLIVEGIFDTFPFWRPGQALSDAVAVLGKVSPPQLEMMLKARRPLLVVFDGDAHREATALAMQLRLGGLRAAALRLPPGVDPDECHEHVKAKARAAFAA